MFNIHNISSGIDQRRGELQIQIFMRNAEETLGANGVDKIEHQEAIAKCLLALYSSRDRYYHTYVHVNDLFENMHRYFKLLTPSERLAILFHDAIYVPGQNDNEGRSIDFMVMLMAGYGIPITEYCWASRCIKETANFLQDVHDVSTHAVLDLDLAPLAAPYVDFMQQNELIGKEFPNAKAQDRAAFMEKFLEKGRIYYKLTELEDSARENIQRYIQYLNE